MHTKQLDYKACQAVPVPEPSVPSSAGALAKRAQQCRCPGLPPLTSWRVRGRTER